MISTACAPVFLVRGILFKGTSSHVGTWCKMPSVVRLSQIVSWLASFLVLTLVIGLGRMIAIADVSFVINQTLSCYGRLSSIDGDCPCLKWEKTIS